MIWFQCLRMEKKGWHSTGGNRLSKDKEDVWCAWQVLRTERSVACLISLWECECGKQWDRKIRLDEMCEREFGLHFVDSFELWKFFKQKNLKYLLLELGGQTIRGKYRAFGANEIIYWSAQKSMVKNLRTWIQ